MPARSDEPPGFQLERQKQAGIYVVTTVEGKSPGGFTAYPWMPLQLQGFCDSEEELFA